ncbi:MAG: hypothetical protein ACQERT_16440 [Thermodesulfobacteriota bacterium]
MHQAPDKPSMLPELLEKISAVPVSMANDGQALCLPVSISCPRGRRSPCRFWSWTRKSMQI